MFAKISQCTAFEAWSTCILKATNARKNAESTERLKKIITCFYDQLETLLGF